MNLYQFCMDFGLLPQKVCVQDVLFTISSKAISRKTGQKILQELKEIDRMWQTCDNNEDFIRSSW